GPRVVEQPVDDARGARVLARSVRLELGTLGLVVHELRFLREVLEALHAAEPATQRLLEDAQRLERVARRSRVKLLGVGLRPKVVELARRHEGLHHLELGKSRTRTRFGVEAEGPAVLL